MLLLTLLPQYTFRSDLQLSVVKYLKSSHREGDLECAAPRSPGSAPPHDWWLNLSRWQTAQVFVPNPPQRWQSGSSSALNLIIITIEPTSQLDDPGSSSGRGDRGAHTHTRTQGWINKLKRIMNEITGNLPALTTCSASIAQQLKTQFNGVHRSATRRYCCTKLLISLIREAAGVSFNWSGRWWSCGKHLKVSSLIYMNGTNLHINSVGGALRRRDLCIFDS